MLELFTLTRERSASSFSAFKSRLRLHVTSDKCQHMIRTISAPGLYIANVVHVHNAITDLTSSVLHFSGIYLLFYAFYMSEYL